MNNEPPATALTVVLADDHAAIREGLRIRLETDFGADIVGEASDGQQAFDLIRSSAPALAIVDVRMPVLDGLGLLDVLHELALPTRVVLLSALTEAHLVQRALDLGAYGYVGKDSPMEVLSDAVRAVIRGDHYIDPTLIARMLEPSSQRLTLRELEVLQLAANGKQNKVIALELGLGEETVKSHLSNVMRKLDANSRTEAVAAAFRRSLID